MRSDMSSDVTTTTGGASEGVFALEARGLSKVFTGGDGRPLMILDGVDFTVAEGEAVAVTGASGAGKSTLLHLLGALDRPSAGEIQVGGRAVARLSDEELAQVRNRRIGFVFQFHHLLREFSALENVMMPALIARTAPAEAERRARALLSDVGLAERVTHKPRQLSGGEQQRVAVARALVNDPVVLLADEPTGNLDTETSDVLHDLLFELREHKALSLVVVTHNPDLARRADRQLVMAGGRLEAVGRG